MLIVILSFTRLKILIMKRNISAFDRVFRVIDAAVIALLFFTHILTGTLAVILMVFAAIFILTGIIGVCPLYKLLGISSCSRKQTL